MTTGKLAICFIPVLVFASCASAQTDISGTWQGRYMFSEITAHVQNVNDTVRGIVIVHEGLNNIVYHFTGTVRGDTIQAFHDDDYAFKGRLTDDARIVGTLTTNKGVTIELTMTRTSPPASGN